MIILLLLQHSQAHRIKNTVKGVILYQVYLEQGKVIMCK